MRVWKPAGLLLVVPRVEVVRCLEQLAEGALVPGERVELTWLGAALATLKLLRPRPLRIPQIVAYLPSSAALPHHSARRAHLRPLLIPQLGAVLTVTAVVLDQDLLSCC